MKKVDAMQAMGIAADAARRFLTWWRLELTDLLEAALQVVWPRMATAMRLDLRSQPVRLLRMTRRASTLIWQNADPQVQQALFAGTLAPPKELTSPARTLEVFLPESAVLVRNVRLPIAAAARLRAVLELQYKRLMPLKREMVLLDHQVLNSDPASGHMTVGLASLRRDVADPIGGLARLWGFRKVVLVVPAGNVSFRFAAGARLAAQARDRVLHALQVSCAALAGLLLVTALFGWKLHDLAVQREIDDLREPAAAVVAIEAEVKARQEVAAALEASMVQPGFVQIVAELTKAVPEDAWIFQLSRRSYELQLAGEASQSSILALRLNESPLFSNVRLGGTTTVAGSNAYGRYEIVLTLDEPAK